MSDDRTCSVADGSLGPDRPGRDAPGHGFGVFTPIVQPINLQSWEDVATPEDLAEIASAAESFGYDYVTVGDHGAVAAAESTLYGSPRFFDPVATIGYLAALTTRLRFATHVYQIPLRSPLITAKSFATLDVLSRGRIIAGFGVGRREYESRAARVPFDDRGGLADDYLRAVVALWSGEPTTQHSDYVDMDDLVCLPKPVQNPRPPVWIGGDRFVGLRRAVRFGDAWTPWTLTPEQVEAMLGRFTDRGNVMPRGFRVVVPIVPLGGRAPRGEPAAPRIEPDRVATERCADSIGRWREAGATDFLVDLPSPSRRALEDSMEWFARAFITYSAEASAT